MSETRKFALIPILLLLVGLALISMTVVLIIRDKGTAGAMSRGKAHLRNGEYEEAVREFSTVIEKAPQNLNPYLERAKAYENLEKYDSAMTDYESALKIAERLSVNRTRRLVDIHKRQEMLSERFGYYPEAADAYRAIAKLKPNDADANNALGWALATLPEMTPEDAAEGVKAATKSCELSHWKKPESIDTLAAAYARKGDFTQAVRWQSKAIGLVKIPGEVADYKSRLTLYQQKKYYLEVMGQPWGND